MFEDVGYCNDCGQEWDCDNNFEETECPYCGSNDIEVG